MIERCPTCHERVCFTTSICPNCGSDRYKSPLKASDKRPSVYGTGIRELTTHPAAFWGALALLVLAMCSFVLDWTLVSESGSIDYRNRITGVRLLVSGQDPYHTKWIPGDPGRLCDPYDNPKLQITKTTVTPAMLVTSLPWANMLYPKLQVLWLIAQWGMLVGLWYLWFWWPGHTPRSRCWWSLLVVGFTYTLAWRHHVDRGQGYLLWALLLSVWMRLGLAKPTKANGWLPGLLGGLLVCLRPPLLLVIAPFIFLRRRNQWLGAVTGLLLGLGAPVLMKPTVWGDYARAMNTWSTVYLTHSEPRPGQRAFPPEIEGMPVDHLASYKVNQFADTSVFRLFYSWGWKAVPAGVALALLCLGFSLWLWMSRGACDAGILLGLAAWSFLADAFLPAYRYPYDDVMILNTFALFPLIYRMGRTFQWMTLLATLLGILTANIHPSERWWIYLPTLVMAAIAVLALQQSARAGSIASKLQQT